MLFAVFRVVHFTMLPPVPDTHFSRDVSIALKRIENGLSLTGIDVRIQLYEVRCSVERVQFNRDIRKRQGLLDPVCELSPGKKLFTKSHVRRKYDLTSTGERKVIVRPIGPALIVYTDRVGVIDTFVTVATFGAVCPAPSHEYSVPLTRILPLQPRAACSIC